jgi:hypothetical protein
MLIFLRGVVMANDNANVAATSNPYEELRNTAIPFADGPKRAQEIADSKQKKLLGFIICMMSFFTQGIGIVFLSQHLSPPVVIMIFASWVVTISILLFGVFRIAQSGIITFAHTWEDIIYSNDLFWIDRGAKPWKRWSGQAIEPSEALADTTELINQYQQQKDEIHETIIKQRGKGKDTGRPETPREEWIKRGLTIIAVEECRDR